MIIKVVELINGTVEEVWEALTDPGEMRKWYFDNIPDFKPEVGFKTRFVMISNDRKFTATWLVTHVIPYREIRYDWTYEEYEGLGPVTFKLSKQAEKTKLTVTNEGLETFPANISEFTEESCRAGWEYFIGLRLPEYFKNKEDKE